VLSHTVSSTRWHELRFNGVAVGEVGINAALCGTWGCPVALVTGDDVVCEESVELLGAGLHTQPVKRALGRFSARHLAPARACVLIEQAAKRALHSLAGAPVYDPGSPCTIAVELATPDDADRFRHRGGVDLTGPRTVQARADRWWDAWRAIYL